MNYFFKWVSPFLKGCNENEKNKGCLCITPTTGDHKGTINIENNEQSQADSEETYPKTIQQSKIFKSFEVW